MESGKTCRFFLDICVENVVYYKINEGDMKGKQTNKPQKTS